MTAAPLTPPPTDSVRVLALASSTVWCGAAVLTRDPTGLRRVESHELAGNDHSRRLLPMARDLLASAQMSWAQIGLIAFDAGPGSFTGLRISCGVAQGLAFALECPVVGVSSLEALAMNAGAPHVLAALDARMGEVYFAEYDCSGKTPVMIGTLDVRPAALASEVLIERARAVRERGGLVACGDAFEKYAEMAQALDALGVDVDARAYPRADAIASIALARYDAGEALAAEHAAPLYVRDKVALNVDEQRAAREARAREVSR